ncbi:MAG: single-stranded DNA-binding protein [Solobacterium sp.]|nr:single-stranded DNA-binding protein [Solobacterium sp.]
MFNLFVVIGRVAEISRHKPTDRPYAVTDLILDSTRPYVSENGTPIVDRYRVRLWRGIGEECASVLQKGDIIAVKGRIQSDNMSHQEKIYYNVMLIAEKVSFITVNGLAPEEDRF